MKRLPRKLWGRKQREKSKNIHFGKFHFDAWSMQYSSEGRYRYDRFC